MIEWNSVVKGFSIGFLGYQLQMGLINVQKLKELSEGGLTMEEISQKLHEENCPHCRSRNENKNSL